MKDKTLDKTQYKPSEQEQLDTYIKNYMKDDPKEMSEEQKQELFRQFQEHMKRQEQSQSDAQMHYSDKSKKEQEMQLDQSKIRKIFEKLNKLTTDPESEESKTYQREIEENERQNKNKKSGQVIIKTMKRGRAVSQQIFNQDQSQIGEEEMIHQKKYIDFKAYKFPEINPIDFKVKSKGKEVKIANYRYPSANKDKKGLVYYMHGYGDYCARYAYFAKEFAMNGYDFIGMDQKGFGYSEGVRGMIDSEQSLIQENLDYIEKANQTFGGDDVPKFIIGPSFGGLLSIKLSLEKEGFFNGMGLLAPYIKLKHEEMLNKYLPIAKIVDKFYPSMKLAPFPSGAKGYKSYLKEFKEDPLNEYKKISVHNVVLNQQLMSKFQNEFNKVKTPFIMILSGQDEVVDNKAAKDFFDIAPVQDKDIITYDDLTHAIIQDKEYLPLIQKDLIAWLDTHC